MTQRGNWLLKAGMALGIRTELNVTVTLLDGTRLQAQARLPDLGAPNGMLVFLAFSEVQAHLEALVLAGYGYSVLDEPEIEEELDLETIRDMYLDWGWSGDPDRKPEWMR